MVALNFYDLRPYQLLAVDKIHRDKRVIVADDMSMGKSAEAIAAKHLIEGDLGQYPTLVVSPSSVAPHWAREIRKWYYKGDKSKIRSISVRNFESDVKDARRADFILAPYSLLSYLGANPQHFDKMRQLEAKYTILDEGHNARNPDSLRTKAARNLLHEIPFLAITTGTPIPNTLVDIYAQLNLLDKVAFPLNEAEAGSIVHAFYEIVKKSPHMIRDILHSRMIRRTAEQYINKKFPILEQRVIDVPLNGDHERTYMAIYENEEIPAAKKLTELVKVSLDPNLANIRFLPDSLAQKLGSMSSCTYAHIDNIVREVIGKKGKIASFTDLKRGIVDALVKRYTQYGALLITGDTDNESKEGDTEREKIRKQFQTSKNNDMLLCTNIMDEGVDLTAATHILHWTVPYMPATFDQRNRRSQRIGAEVEKERVCSMVLKPTLSNGAPTINEGIMQLLDEKRRIINFIINSPEKLTIDDLEQIKNGHPEQSSTLAAYLSPKVFVEGHFGSLKGRGGARILADYQNKPYIAQDIARAYVHHWEGYYGGNSATLTSKIITKILDGKQDARLVDIASGPFSLSRRLGIPVTNLDLNQQMLDAGRVLEQEGVVPKGNIAHQGLANDLPFEDASFDLANCSLALHMSNLSIMGSGMSEREEILREANRILPLGGHYIFTLPHSVIHRSNVPSFREGLKYLGFDILPQTGFYKGSSENSNFKVFLGALQKSAEPAKDPVSTGFLRWKMDDRLQKRVGRTRSPRKYGSGKKKKDAFELVSEFVQEDSNVRVSATSNIIGGKL